MVIAVVLVAGYGTASALTGSTGSVPSEGNRAEATAFGRMFLAPHRVTRTFTSPALIARLIGFLNGLHAAPDGIRSCPAETVIYQLTFVSGRVPAVVISPDDCSDIGVTVAGKTQPALRDQHNVLAGMVALLPGFGPSGY
jgi:hypothetical protein